MVKPIIIIGGNIAGLSAAYHLAGKGCPVTVYERKIWNKPCGGAISIEFARYLKNELGLDIPAVNLPMRRIRFCFSNLRHVLTDGLFVIISRDDLQRQLFRRLQQEPNVNIIFERITLRNSSRLSRQSILATGFSGLTRQIIGIEWYHREYALALTYKGRLPSLSNDPAHLMFFDSRLKGYGWVFCSGNRHFNAGIGALIEKRNIYKEFDTFRCLINNRFGYGLPPGSLPAVWKIPIELNYQDKPVSYFKRGIEFIGVGDVLGLAHPVIAAGIEPAWQSGWLLGESYDRATHSIDTKWFRHLLKKNLPLTSRKPFDIMVSNILRLNGFPFKDPMAYLLMKLFHRQIIQQIKQYPWFALVHNGREKTGFNFDKYTNRNNY